MVTGSHQTRNLEHFRAMTAEWHKTLNPHPTAFELAKDAFFLKQAVQNFDRVETASFVQRGLLHFLLALAFVFTMAATGKLELRWRR